MPPSSLIPVPEVSQSAIEFTPEMDQALLALSPAHLQFVKHAVKDPAFLDRAQFKSLEEKHCSVKTAIQSWPTLLGPSMVAQMQRISVGLGRAIKRIPREIFGLDAEAISEYYHLDRNFIQHFVLPYVSDQIMEGAIGRGDFLLAPDKLWCVEFNMSVSLGGVWEATAFENMMQSVPVLAGYLRENKLHAQTRNVLRLFMHHAIHEAKRFSKDWNGQVNVAYVASRTRFEMEQDIPEYLELREFFQEEYKDVLKECGGNASGSFILCNFEELWTDNGRVFFGNIPLNVVIEMTFGDVPLHVLRCYERGTFNLHNGPITYLLCNKFTMALLSEFQDAGIFTEEEEHLIQAHVPWTRKVIDDTADFEGVTVALPQFMRENQHELVLKKSISASGQDVVAGPHVPPEEWDAGIARALQEADWTVQKYIKYPQLPYQHGTYGCCLHDVVFGLFVFGNSFGGNFMRVLAKDRGGVVNRQRGSLDAICLELL